MVDVRQEVVYDFSHDVLGHPGGHTVAEHSAGEYPRIGPLEGGGEGRDDRRIVDGEDLCFIERAGVFVPNDVVLGWVLETLAFARAQRGVRLRARYDARVVQISRYYE